MFNIGKYQCISKIGEGANSNVYSAQSQKTLEPLVLKIPKKAISFDNEKKILSTFHHNGIVKLIDSFQENSKQILVLEYGKDLFDYIMEIGRLTEKDAKNLFRPIFEAVLYLHTNEIIHRDIKLENIIITEKQGLKLIDFDLSYEIKSTNSINKNNISNKKNITPSESCGTFQYIAPEILKCLNYGKEVDIWALGITLYAAIAGMFPFESEDQYSYTFEVLTKNPSFEFDDLTVSDNFKDLIEKMLNKDPSKRITISECLNHPWFG
ncbi:hypothetical protein M9Y10_035414 [Tritrichomonas musculus]|uniref:Protein kinase domain-containing protein n=1 Tax=Tritrichomonas musculus TaxID=1915356 RepID=A0ABR2KHK6_9EUKA